MNEITDDDTAPEAPSADRPTDRDPPSAHRLPPYSPDPEGEGWRAIYTRHHVPLPDGGGTFDLPAAGDRVRDREGDGDELVVVATHPGTAAEDYPLDALDGATVADANPDYDGAAPVVEAVYAEAARAALGEWRDVEDLRDAVTWDAVDAYSFPAPRLAVVERGEA